jgi:two-component system CheB/CheR fusion protein
MSFPIVGIGASAGGLESFSELLSRVPANMGMAYVFVQHLDPRHASRLVEISLQEGRLSGRTSSGEIGRENPP